MYLTFFLKDPSEPEKIGMEGVVKFLEDLSLDPTSRLVSPPLKITLLQFFLAGAHHCLEVQGSNAMRVQQGGVPWRNGGTWVRCHRQAQAEAQQSGEGDQRSEQVQGVLPVHLQLRQEPKSKGSRLGNGTRLLEHCNGG